jgi:pimeloyl-ACP methyl ester carboxylesterase
VGSEEVDFASGDGRCAGRLFRPDAGGEGLPCVVMDAVPGFAAITPAESSWRNEVCARVALAPPYSLAKKVRRISCPALYLVFEEDDVNPPQLGRRAAERAPRGELREYPGGHFAPFSADMFDRVLADQVGFLNQVLS